MIAALMAYGLIATGLLLVAGRAMEVASPVEVIPRRFIWCAAILLSCGLTLNAGRALVAPEESAVVAGATGARLEEGAREASHPNAPTRSPGESLQSNIADAMSWPVSAAARADLSSRALLMCWSAASGLLLLVGIGTALRDRRLRSRWQVVEMEGHQVRLSPGTGPAVRGTLRPEIVVPRWLLASSAEERRLALLHESEHLRTRDGTLLAAAWVVVTILPWNLPLWWMVLRLRLAIEIDCDHRVIAGGAERRSYGSMLIDISGHPSGYSITTPALAGFPSDLERRLVAMTSRKSRYNRARGCFGVLLGSAAFLAACRADLPTAAEIEALDASAAAESARQLGIEATTYYINSERATAEMAAALPPGSIATVDVTREGRVDGVEAGSIHIYTRNTGAPNYVIDEIPVTPDEFHALPPDEIESIVIQRGPDASEAGFRASGGAVVVTTKAASSQERTSPEVEGQTTPVIGAEFGNGNLVTVRSDSAEEEIGPVLEAEPDGYSLRFVAPVDTTAREGGDDAIPLRNMGEPLYVIDDVISSAADFNRLGPGNIESISVVKAATPSEFSNDPRARNGVIVVRTKR